jgi:hypothetical protein
MTQVASPFVSVVAVQLSRPIVSRTLKPLIGAALSVRVN